jgi:hypothetical protein
MEDSVDEELQKFVRQSGEKKRERERKRGRKESV